MQSGNGQIDRAQRQWFALSTALTAHYQLEPA